jgi:hypothetical protein
MIVRLVISAKPVEKEEIRSLIQAIRQWEATTVCGEVAAILIQTEDEQLTQAELNGLCQGIYSFDVVRVVDDRHETERVLRLGSRGVSIDGKIIGICEGLNLIVGEDVSESEIASLQNGQTITLSRMGRG